MNYPILTKNIKYGSPKKSFDYIRPLCERNESEGRGANIVGMERFSGADRVINMICITQFKRQVRVFICVSLKKHVRLTRVINKEKCHYRSTMNLQYKHEKPLHPPKVTVWAAMLARGIIDERLWFQQDGAIYTSNMCLPRVRELFLQKLIYGKGLHPALICFP